MKYSKVLLVEPDFFDVVDCRNPHMKQSVAVDKTRARQQWLGLASVYQDLQAGGDLDEVAFLRGVPGLIDFVFCANPAVTWLSGNTKKAFMSSMRHSPRHAEVSHIKRFLETNGYQTTTCSTGFFEGTGDCIWQPNGKVLFCGYGYRTDVTGLNQFHKHIKNESFNVVDLELCDPRFYHLDTCFMPINESTVVIYDKAFTQNALSKITKHFKDVETVSEKEALNFALNGHIIRTLPRRKDVCIIQKGNPQTESILQREGIRIISCELDEFNKSGGSVFCMKLEFN